ncbi:Spo0B domain-containing protein [Paenibacillus sp. R14(2021)]|uniref:Spo0B domain-containing protein n=1 Tax=Paenibacillus sp. R14(2021) TaxID=2859228 RepID=UPI001C614468|nr:Spo0B domain-containing protein [Paenibacillus sp. R14(2021)]
MNRTSYYAASSIIVPAAAVLIWPSQQGLLVLFVIWTVLAAWLWFRSIQNEQQRRYLRLEQTMQETAITTLNHHRHDWMNDLQVLYGYIRMGKMDKTIPYVEQIRERMMSESKIAKLGDPALIMFLQSFRTQCNTMVIDMDIDGDVNLADLPLDGRRAAETVMALIQAYRFATAPNYGEPAKLLIDLSRDEDELHISFHFDGDLKSPEEWKTNCERALQGSPLFLADTDYDEGSLALEAKLGK